jgi:hypothetical protein
MRRLRSLTLVALAALTVVSAACSGGSAEADAAKAKKVEAIGADKLPATLLGLKLAPESIIDTVKANKGSYVEAIGMFSMRKGDLLQATLQVSRFTENAHAERGSFRRSIIQQIGSTEPQEYRMGSQSIFLTTGKQQRISVWFKGRSMYILTTSVNYMTPRSLLREAIKEVTL